MPYSSPPQVVGSSGGVLSGGLTVAGGVVTILSGGAAAPILIAAGAGIGLASGLTGAGASVSRQCGPLSLVEAQRGSALIGRELHSVVPPVSLMP